MLAQAFTRQFQESKIKYVGTDTEVDLTSKNAVENFSRSHRFTHIVNAAAYTRVDDAETNHELATAVNATAVRYLCEEADHHKATLIHISTDYVFSGVASTPYREDFEPSPRSVYGRTKLAGEEWLKPLMNKSAAVRAYLLRTSWMFGPGGPNFVRTILKALQTQTDVRVVHDQRGRPTYSDDLASAVVTLSGLSGLTPPASPGCYHFANTGEVTWHEFTVAIAEARGAIVTQRPFDGYASQRNAGLGLAFKYPWVLILDADERVPAPTAAELRRFVAEAPTAAAARLRRRDFLLGSWLRHAQISPYYIRLVRPQMVRYEREINEVLRVDGEIVDLAEPFDHYPFSKGFRHWIDKHNTYSTMEAGTVNVQSPGATDDMNVGGA